jgi:hypothetical protein
MAELVYEDLEGQNGSFENPGGTGRIVYFSSISEMETIQPAPVFGSGEALGDDVIITSDHVWKSGKKPNIMSMLPDSGKALAELVGDPGGKSVSSTFECKYVGVLKKVLGMQRKMKNDQFIFWIPLADGQVLQVGTKLLPATAEGGADFAGTKEGVRAMNVKVEATSQSAWLYTGTLPEVVAV